MAGLAEPEELLDRGGQSLMKPFTAIAIAIFALIMLVHLYRLVRPFEVVVDGATVPQWASFVGLVVAGGLAMMLWRESRG